MKMGLGLLLLPVCVGISISVYSLIYTLFTSASGWISNTGWGFILGFFVWFFVSMTFEFPARAYVLAHELTHALWGLLMGAKVSELKVSSQKGSVRVSKQNLWITLSPYFFPFYTFIVLILYACTCLFFRNYLYKPFWFGMIGLTWGFHLTYTVKVLLAYQSDISKYGVLLSLTIIYLVHMFEVGAIFSLLTTLSFKAFISDVFFQIAECYSKSYFHVKLFIMNVL